MITGFDRPNLRFSVEEPKNKQQMLLALLDERKKKSGIIYCSTRKQVDTLCDLLSEKGFAVTKYHAGLPEAERRVRQDDFVYDRARIMVATNAFGMGIDKSNVSFVIHYNMPKSLEEYYQEAGRAGRDGGAADCILLFSPGDIFTARFLIENASENENAPDEERTETVRHGMHLLNSMVGYCKTTRCLRSYILDYFGQSHDERCGNCGNCDASITEKDITNEAKMILSCVQRIYRHLGYAVGAALAVQVLRGSRSKRITELSLDRLSTYGLMRSYARQTVCRMIDALQEQGLLAVNPTYGTLVLTERSRAVLFNGQQVYMQVKETAINKDTVPPDRQPDSVQTQNRNQQTFRRPNGREAAFSHRRSRRSTRPSCMRS